MKKSFFLLCMVFCMAPLFQYCKKDSTAGLTSLPAVENYDFLNEKIKDQYDVYGQTTYQYFKYYAAFHQPQELLAKPLADAFMPVLKLTEEANQGLTVFENLKKNKEFFTDQQYQFYTDFYTDFLAKMGASNTLREAWAYLRSYEVQLLTRKDVAEKDKRNILIFCSVFRNALKYGHEIGTIEPVVDPKSIKNGNLQLRDDCLFGKKLSCWGSTVSQAGINGVLSGIQAWAQAGIKGSYNALSKFLPAAEISAALSLITGVSNLLKNNACNCDGASATPYCNQPTGVSIDIVNCSNTQHYMLNGVGNSYTGTYNYSATNGTFPDFGGGSSASNVPSNSIRVTVTDPSQPLTVYGSIPCNGTTYGASSNFDVIAQRGDPGTAIINGASSAPVGSTQNYYISGTSLFNSNNTITISHNYAGSGPNNLTGPGTVMGVTWNIISSGYNQGSVSAYVQNSCSSNGVSAYLSVNVY